MKGFEILHGSGFRVQFSNGMIVSVQFGCGNYCDNYHDEPLLKTPHSYESPNAEVAVLNENIDFATRKVITFIDEDQWVDDCIIREATPDQVLRIMNAAANWRR